MVQSNKYYKTRAVGVTSEVDLTTDQDLGMKKRHDVFYTSAIPEVTWYKSLYNSKLELRSRYYLHF